MKKTKIKTLTLEEAKILLAKGRELQDELIIRIKRMTRITADDLKVVSQ